ncbi:MAG TPA: alpha-hydroxy-acid oxidizing protein, partial [Pseudonocardiaceae bacterium]
MPSQLSGYQNEIYLAGLGGQVPPFTTNGTALEQAASSALAPGVFGYVAGAAGSGATNRA